MDVRRSFNQTKYLSHESLSNILKCYALSNPYLNYCQGMNFMAGFLFLTMMPQQLETSVLAQADDKESAEAVYKTELTRQGEWLAFSVMTETIDRFQMSQLFNSELPMLKQMFYQLDRLISIYLPDLHDHFRDEKVNSSFYSSSFFITIFSSNVGNCVDATDTWKVQRIWDHFIVKGWKIIFKVCILMLRIKEEMLLGLGFDELLRALVKIPQEFLIEKPCKIRTDIWKEEPKNEEKQANSDA